MVEACCFYSLIGLLGPDLQYNDGMREVVRLIFAPRTITNAEAPAPVSSYQKANLKLVDVILEALAPVPTRARHRQLGLVGLDRDQLASVRASRPVESAIRDPGLGLWRRVRP